jgi:hypothetical protein
MMVQKYYGSPNSCPPASQHSAAGMLSTSSSKLGRAERSQTVAYRFESTELGLFRFKVRATPVKRET